MEERRKEAIAIRDRRRKEEARWAREIWGDVAGCREIRGDIVRCRERLERDRRQSGGGGS